MRESIRVVLAAAGIVVVSGGSVLAITVPTDEDATFAGLFVVGDPPVIPEGTAGELVVAMQGPGSGSIAPVVVRNNTDDVVYDIIVEGIARDAAGTLIATGHSQQMLPYAVPAGGIAFSYVYFEAGLTPGGLPEVVVTNVEGDVVSGGDQATEMFEYQVRASETYTSGVSTLPISEATIVERDVVGLVHNPGTNTVPAALVAVACFNDAGELTYAYWGSTDGDEIAPDGFAGFTLPSGGDCSSAVLAASG
jgi:hypothetical protein